MAVFRVLTQFPDPAPSPPSDGGLFGCSSLGTFPHLPFADLLGPSDGGLFGCSSLGTSRSTFTQRLTGHGQGIAVLFTETEQMTLVTLDHLPVHLAGPGDGPVVAPEEYKANKLPQVLRKQQSLSP